MTIEIMPPDVGCHMSCPHCPIRLKETGSHGQSIRPTFQRLQEYTEGLPRNVHFMTNNFADILPFTADFQVRPENTQIGMMMFDNPPVQSIIDVFAKLGAKGFKNINLGISSRETDITKHQAMLAETLNWYWKQVDIRHCSISINNNTISPAKLLNIRQAATLADTNAYEDISKNAAMHGIRLLEPEWQNDDDSTVYAYFCRMKLSEKTVNIAHRIIAPKAPYGALDEYCMQTKQRLLNKALFSYEEMILSFTALGVRVLHSTADIHNPYLWITYQDFAAIMDTSRGINEVCAKIHCILDLGTEVPLLETPYNGMISEETLAYISEKRQKLW